jgi:hypothetical protein
VGIDDAMSDGAAVLTSEYPATWKIEPVERDDATMFRCVHIFQWLENVRLIHSQNLLAKEKQ